MAKRIHTPKALVEAKSALQEYFKKHKLDPLKDYTKDPVHGKFITPLITKLNFERDKLDLSYPLFDLKNEVKLVNFEKMKKEKKAKKAQEAKEQKVQKETKKKVVKKEKEVPVNKNPRIVAKYSYPLVDGREMTPDEKRKYRAAQRKAKKETGQGVTADPKPKKSDKDSKPKKSLKAKAKKSAED